MTESIRIYWNGIKVNGEKKLIRCGYSLDNNADHAPSVSIYARDYDNLPRDLFDVKNETDLYTDYFDNDHARLTPEHPLYKYFRYAAEKAQARMDRPYCEKLRATLNSGRREPWPGHYKALREDLARREKFLEQFDATQDPGQPTALDLAQIHQAAQEAENARREAEHQEELAARERALNARNEGRRYIEAVAAEHPITEGAPVVLIHWSEHPAFYSWDDDELELSMAAAEIILARYDAEAAADDSVGYYKTKFSITWTAPDTGEKEFYNEGRYDLGDNEGGLVNHIRAYNPEVADFLQGWTVGGRVVSVTVAPWLEAYNKAKKERAKQDAAEILDMVQMLTDDQLEDAIMANPYDDAERRDVARFFLQELARRDRPKALEIFQKWIKGAA